MIDHARLLEVLHYESSTGLFTWLVDRTPSIRAGAIAGALQSNGYIHIKIDERTYKAHRLAWFFIHRKWPVEFIDHRNMVKDDNRIENLREASRSQNNTNRKVPANSLSGHTGVGWNCRSKKWCARVVIGGKRRNVGFFTHKEEAIAARNAAALTAYGSFANLGG